MTQKRSLKMNKIAINIRQRLSLRKPLAEALDVVEHLTDLLSLEKQPADADNAAFLKKELAKVKIQFPHVKDFEREFPSFAFSIATGIGKTRLMGACIAYLYLAKGIRHFFVLAPNLTLYEKLIRDFSDQSYEKYVFKGIAEFVSNAPVVVTGDNYEKHRKNMNHPMFPGMEAPIEINIFNIAKFNTENKTSKKGGEIQAPRMRRLSEYIGQSYYDYLAGLSDLVILMDEAHRYHADASKKAINELRPVLGLEMTATPTDEKGKLFKNIVYEYNLAQALADGKYVKNPTVAKRKDFSKGNMSDTEVDTIKLEDAVSVHEKAKLHLEKYALDHNVPLVKPFILVVCRNIQHAKETVELLESSGFYEGRYQGKVLQIDSSTKKQEEIEQQFVSLEKPDNKIEIVVHVNMLKEGWDVTNLYTIVPLRAADAPILIEQSIGRGLRLPYGGQRTGDPEVDKLTVIAHENFEAVIAKANDPNSVLSKLTYIVLDKDEDVVPGTKIVTAPTVQQTAITDLLKQAETAPTVQKQKEIQANVDARRAVWTVLETHNITISNTEQLLTPEETLRVEEEAVAFIKSNAATSGSLFAEEEAKEQIAQVKQVLKVVISEFVENVIPIPRITIQQDEVKAVYNWFNLDTSLDRFKYSYINPEIIRVGLKDKSVETFAGTESGLLINSPRDLIVGELINNDDIDYDKCNKLLYHLANQAIETIASYGHDNKVVAAIVHQHKNDIAEKIYNQVMQHFEIQSSGFKASKILPFIKILPQNMTEVPGYGKRDFRDIIESKSVVKKYIFTGFLKSYFTENKFDSSTEQDFAYVLEADRKVLRWLRPAPNQFSIYWGNGAKKYEPDFIVETEDAIYMIETKASKNVDDKDVNDKRAAAELYCERATEFTTANSGKPWHYIMLRHDHVTRTNSFEYLIQHNYIP
ncbi:restriction endonuclease subunit R [Bacteroides intestinalis]|uniref:Restriction endonuclease subunit R n=2 Tax=Bacteroides intestinalis TaxID=329854 RepID=A0A412XXB8_9BACE|nr:restriction endonuclease subunit R [Bacteroides intestinalis]RHA55462.1 restriction endonuclease subunit R [Bacteroides intestinalis]